MPSSFKGLWSATIHRMMIRTIITLNRVLVPLGCTHMARLCTERRIWWIGQSTQYLRSLRAWTLTKTRRAISLRIKPWSHWCQTPSLKRNSKWLRLKHMTTTFSKRHRALNCWISNKKSVLTRKTRSGITKAKHRALKKAMEAKIQMTPWWMDSNFLI